MCVFRIISTEHCLSFKLLYLGRPFRLVTSLVSASKCKFKKPIKKLCENDKPSWFLSSRHLSRQWSPGRIEQATGSVWSGRGSTHSGFAIRWARFWHKLNCWFIKGLREIIKAVRSLDQLLTSEILFYRVVTQEIALWRNIFPFFYMIFGKWMKLFLLLQSVFFGANS